MNTPGENETVVPKPLQLENVSLFEFLMDLFLHPNKFLTAYISLKKLPFFFPILWMSGIAAVIDRIDTLENLIAFFFLMIAAGYSTFLFYRGVRLVQKTKLIRSIIFFVLIPTTFYIFIVGTLLLTLAQD